MKRILFIALISVAGVARASIPINDVLPKALFTCSETVIADIGPRLEGDTDYSSGVSVFFKNQGMQVGYDKLSAVIHSRIGDRVLVCLVDVPKNCPKGDDRGKVYTTTNLRTLESWTLPDSEHSCGGA